MPFHEMCIRDRCWSDIDFESGFITIQHNLVYHDHEVGGCYFTMSTPKTAAGKRAIPILPEVRKALEQERTNQQDVYKRQVLLPTGHTVEYTVLAITHARS